MQRDWKSDIRFPAEKLRIDPAKAPELFRWGSHGESLSEDKLTPNSLAAALRGASNRAERDTILYDAVYRVRDHLGGFVQDSLQSGSLSAPNVKSMRKGVERDYKYVKAMEVALSQAAEAVDPAAREIIAAEIRGLADSRKRMYMWLSDRPEEVISASFSPEDQSYFTMINALENGARVSPEIVNYSGNCEWYDPTFRDHTGLNFVLLFHSTKPKDRWMWKAAIPKLWRGYSYEGKCPGYIPGVMLLHISLTVGGDARATETRQQLDDLIEADAGWAAQVYRALGHAEAFQDKPLLARLGVSDADRRVRQRDPNRR